MGIKMPVKVYKRRNASRSEAYQNALLEKAYPNWQEFPVFYDDERDTLARPTKRQEPELVAAASFALFADTEADLLNFLRLCKKNKPLLILYGAEENFQWYPKISLKMAVQYWKSGRRSGAAMRGAQASAVAKKAKTAERFALIADRWPLPSKEYPAKALLKEAGIRSINTVNNLHIKVDRNGKLVTKTREKFQAEYQAAQKRKARRHVS